MKDRAPEVQGNYTNERPVNEKTVRAHKGRVARTVHEGHYIIKWSAQWRMTPSPCLWPGNRLTSLEMITACEFRTG